MVSSSPGVRRLCVCVGAPYPGLLDRACRTGGFGRLYTERFADIGCLPVQDVDLGFASPGEDEAVLISDLISALYAEAAEAAVAHLGPPPRVLAAFHVGITRIEGDGIRGSAVIRIIGLLRDLALATVPSAARAPTLIAGISASLYGEISTERDFSAGWCPLGSAEAVCRAY